MCCFTSHLFKLGTGDRACKGVSACTNVYSLALKVDVYWAPHCEGKNVDRR